MIQDIYPSKLDNSYKDHQLRDEDIVLIFNDEGKLIGDCEPGLDVAFQSPVPGGCGLLTRLAVIENLISLAE